MKEKIERGHIGKKVGKGFFEYQGDAIRAEQERQRDIKLLQLLRILYYKNQNERGEP